MTHRTVTDYTKEALVGVDRDIIAGGFIKHVCMHGTGPA